MAACIAVPVAGRYAIKGGVAVSKAAQTATEAEKLIISADHATGTLAHIAPSKAPKLSEIAIDSGKAAQNTEKVLELSSKAVKLGPVGRDVLFEGLRKVVFREAMSPEQEAAVLKVVTGLIEANGKIVNEITEDSLNVLATIIKKYPILAMLESKAWLRIVRGGEWKNIMSRIFEELWYIKIRNFAHGSWRDFSEPRSKV
jgi:hypothetical protein